MVAAQFVEAPDGRCTMSSAPSAAIASATIVTTPDGRCERRGERCAANGLGMCCYTPLACEQHGDEHLEPLHADATVQAANGGLRRSLARVLRNLRACVCSAIRAPAHACISLASQCA
jgi:hypothetical protein